MSPCLCGPHALTPHLSMTRVVSTSGCGDAAVDALFWENTQKRTCWVTGWLQFSFPEGPPHCLLRPPRFAGATPEEALAPVGAERTTPTEPTAGGPAGIGARPPPACVLAWGCGLGLAPLPWPRSPRSEAEAEGQVWGPSCAQDPTWGGERGQLVRLSFPG